MRSVILFFSIFMACAAQAARYPLKVKEMSTVAANQNITLGNLIADQFQIPDLVLYGKIHNIVIDEVATEGEKTIPGNLIISKVRQILSFTDLQRVAISIPENIQVKVQRNFLSQNEIIFQVRNQIESFCHSCEVEVEDLRIPELPSREEVLGWRIDYSPLKNSGGFLLPLNVETSKGRLPLWISGRVGLYTQVYVAKRAIKANEKVTLADFSTQRMKLSFMKDRFANSSDFENKLAVKYIGFGQAIYVSDLKAPYATLRGQQVKVMLQPSAETQDGEQLEISIVGIAKQDGYVGDRIQIEYPETKKVLIGEIVDQNTVRVQ